MAGRGHEHAVLGTSEGGPERSGPDTDLTRRRAECGAKAGNGLFKPFLRVGESGRT